MTAEGKKSLVPANDNYPAWPRGLSRVYAARYSGYSLSTWDKMVSAGDMPQPKRAYGRTVWDKIAVDRAFDLLDGGNTVSPAGEIDYDVAA